MDFIKFSFLVQKTLNKQKAHLYIIGNVVLQVTEILLFLFSNFTCKKRRQQTPTFLLVRLLFRRDVTNHYCLLVCFSSIIFFPLETTLQDLIYHCNIFNSQEVLLYREVMCPTVWPASTGGVQDSGISSISSLCLSQLSTVYTDCL